MINEAFYVHLKRFSKILADCCSKVVIMFCFGFMEEGASGMDQTKAEKPCTDIFGRIDISKCFFVLRRTAAFEADQGKVCDSLGALLPSLHYTVQTWSKHCTLLSPKLADSTCTFGPIFRETSLSSLFSFRKRLAAYMILSVGRSVGRSVGPSVRRSVTRLLSVRHTFVFLSYFEKFAYGWPFGPAICLLMTLMAGPKGRDMA